MPPPPSPSILQARGVGIRNRVKILAMQAIDPVTKDQIALVATAVRDAMAWLHEPTPKHVRDRLVLIDASLQAQAKRLDELEDLLRDRRAAAAPKD